MNESPCIDERNMIGFIGRFSRQGELMISGTERQIAPTDIPTDDDNHENTENDQEKFPQEIEEAIEQGRAVAAVDVSVKGKFMSACWIITSLDNRNHVEGNIHSSQWEIGQIPTAEGLGVCNLIKEINHKCSHISRGNIIIYMDNKKILKGCANDIVKDNQCV